MRLRRKARGWLFLAWRFQSRCAGDFRCRSAHHDPADFTEIKFYAVEVFAARDGPFQKLRESRIAEIGDGFLFLVRLYVEIDAAVMIFAKFGVQRGEQLAQGFAVPGHQLGEEESGNGGVAFGEMQAGAEAAAFFAADENVLFEHEFADVFESDGHFVELAAEAVGDFVDELGD